jgi:hypothetical protein
LLGSEYAWIDDSPDPVVVTDADGVVAAVNAVFRSVFAVPDSDLGNAPVEDLIIASRYRAAYRAARRLALTTRQSLVAGPTSGFVAVQADGGEFAANLSFARTNVDPPHLATWIQDLTRDQSALTPPPSREALHERVEELAGFGTWESLANRILWSDNLFRIYGHGLLRSPHPPSMCWRTVIPTIGNGSNRPRSTCVVPAWGGIFGSDS